MTSGPPSELMYGIPQGDVILKSAIIAALDDVRANPWLLEYIFAGLMTDSVVKGEHGRLEIDAAKSWFLSTQVHVHMDSPMNEPQFPSISISIGTSSEAEVTLADLHHNTSAVAEVCSKALTPNFALDYDSSTGVGILPTDVAAKFVVAPGMLLVDGVGAKHQILEVIDGRTFRLAKGIQSDLNRCVIRGSMPDSFVSLESVNYREVYSINVHTTEVVHSQWLTSILKFCLLRYKQRLLEARGLERSKFSVQGPVLNPNFGQELVWTQGINFEAYIRYSWPKDFSKTITTVRTVVGVEDEDIEVGGGWGLEAEKFDSFFEASVVGATSGENYGPQIFRAQDVIIQRIPGLTSGNVQDALAELKAAIDELEQETLSLRQDITNLQSGFGSLQGSFGLHESSSSAHGVEGEVVGTENSQTLLNKILASPVIAGDLLPATSGQQALGSAARPWGPGYFAGPLEIDQGNVTNQRSIHIKNGGGGTTGIRYEGTGGQGSWELSRSGSWYAVTASNRSVRHIATGSAYDAVSHTAWSYSDRVTSRVAFAITGGVTTGRTADLLQLRPTESSPPEDSVFRVGVNGEVETLAGVILHSPNGTRYRITVADDGSLATEPA